MPPKPPTDSSPEIVCDTCWVTTRLTSSSVGPVFRKSAMIWSSRLLVASTSAPGRTITRSEEHTSELQSLMRISYAVFCLKKNKNKSYIHNNDTTHKV